MSTDDVVDDVAELAGLVMELADRLAGASPRSW